MFGKILAVSVATAALAISAPALAAGHGGGGGGGGMGGMGGNPNAGMGGMGGMGGPSSTAIDARANSQGPMNASPNGIEYSSPNSVLHTNSTTTTTQPTTTTTNPAAGVSQGPAHASTTGIAHANQHSVLASGAVPSTSLPGLTTNLSVQTSTGTSLGTVSQIVTDSSGNIRLVIVTNTTTGQTYRLAPNTLSISGGVVTTTWTP